jgi:hypothetical protein
VIVAGAIAVITLPVGHQPGRPATAQLTAWTVIKHADGSITVTFRELHDLAGLQRMLRADGVPASITLFGKQNPACRPYPPGQPRSETRRQTIIVATLGGKGPSNMVIRGSFTSNSVIIDPSALPSGAGLQIGQAPRSAWAEARSSGSGPAWFRPVSNAQADRFWRVMPNLGGPSPSLCANAVNRAAMEDQRKLGDHQPARAGRGRARSGGAVSCACGRGGR